MLRNEDLFDFEAMGLVRPLLEAYQYPFEVLTHIHAFLEKLMEQPLEGFDEVEKGVFVSQSAHVARTACLLPPCIICADAEIRHGAFIRGNAFVGCGAVVGNSTELKNCLLSSLAEVPHFNYVGDSILGYKAHMGAGAICSNVKSDKCNVLLRMGKETMDTHLQKCGAFLGDGVEVGCNSVLGPGTVIGKGSRIYPLSFIRGTIEAHKLYKNRGEIIALDAKIGKE